MKKSSTDTCCLTLPLKLEKWQEDRLAKRFEIARQLYNTLVHAELKRLVQIKRTAEYRENERKIRTLDWNNPAHRTELEKLYEERRKSLKKAGFTDNSFTTDMGKYYKHFRDNIGSSVAVHGIAPQVWAAFDKLLFKKGGKKVHYKKPGEVNSVQGYSRTGKSGGTEIMFRGPYIEWKGLKLPAEAIAGQCLRDRYAAAQSKACPIGSAGPESAETAGMPSSFWRGSRDQGDPVTGKAVHPIGSGPVGLDIGPQTLAYSAAGAAGLVELADRVQNIEQEKHCLQRKMDRSRRATNPDNYAEDGTIRRGVKLTHNKSKRYRRSQQELKYLQHRQAEIRKLQHIQLANHLLSLGDHFYVEKMEWSSLTHRAKKTVISEKTGKPRSKKRFGKSIANKAPAMLIEILRQKCKSLGLPNVVEINPADIKASQYNHLTGEYVKKSLSRRWNEMQDGEHLQRDLYSAFLLQHYDSMSKALDLDSLARDYPAFVQYHHREIERLHALLKTPASMGIRRSIA